MRKITIIVILLPGLLSVVSCQAPVTPQAMTFEVVPTQPSPSSTAVTSPIPATLIVPSVTPSPSATSLPPTTTTTPGYISLSQIGPFILFKGQTGIWIANQDGSFLTQLTSAETQADLRQLISPAGDLLAVVVNDEQGLYLEMIDLPRGATQQIANLINSPAPEIFDPINAYAFALYAIRDYGSLAWQPGDGRLLAFTGAINGPTADLHTYDTQTGEIKQLTDGPSQAVLPTWSPDGQYILHFGVSWVPPFGGALGGANRLDGTWAVRVSDGKIITLPKNEGSNPKFVGWQDDTHYITYDPGECAAQNLRSIDVATGQDTPIMVNSFYYYIARSLENGALLFSSAADCPGSLGEGIYLLMPGQPAPTQLNNKRAWEIDWMPESGLFDAYPEGLYSSDGRRFYEPPVYDRSFEPAVSIAGYQAWEVIEDFKGRVVVRVPGEDWQTILNGLVDGLIWDPVDGTTLLIVFEDGSLYSATYPDFNPQLIGSLGGRISQVIWSP